MTSCIAREHLENLTPKAFFKDMQKTKEFFNSMNDDDKHEYIQELLDNGFCNEYIDFAFQNSKVPEDAIQLLIDLRFFNLQNLDSCTLSALFDVVQPETILSIFEYLAPFDELDIIPLEELITQYTPKEYTSEFWTFIHDRYQPHFERYFEEEVV